MADMLVRLYNLPDGKALEAAAEDHNVVLRRAESFERIAVLEFVQEHWPEWLEHGAAAFSHVPPRMYVAVWHGVLAGFAAWDALRPGVCGPIGTAPDARGMGAGA